MSETRLFNLGAVYSTLTGFLYCDIGEVYEVCDYMEGYPHWTHELPDAIGRLKPHLEKAFPGLLETTLPPDMTPEEIVNWFQSLTKVELPIIGNGERTEGPLSSLARMMDKGDNLDE